MAVLRQLLTKLSGKGKIPDSSTHLKMTFAVLHGTSKYTVFHNAGLAEPGKIIVFHMDWVEGRSKVFTTVTFSDFSVN